MFTKNKFYDSCLNDTLNWLIISKLFKKKFFFFWNYNMHLDELILGMNLQKTASFASCLKFL